MNIALVCIHGIMGSPRQFDPVGARLFDRCDVIAPVLPGHGGNALDFAKSSMEAWQEAVDRTVADACGKYDRVILLGHSMGGLLLWKAAMKYPAAGLIAVAMPLKFRYLPHALFNCLKVTFTKIPCVPREMCGVDPHPLYACFGWIPRYLELFRKAREIRSCLKQIQAPVRCFYFERDELCSPASAGCMPPQIPLKMLPDCRHSEWTGETYDAIADAVLDLLESQN